MKKLYCLLAIIAVFFASCDPLSSTYKTLDAIPSKTGINLTLAASDYALIGNKALNFKTATDANATTNVPAILNIRYPNAANLTNANVTFALAPSSSSVLVPDSTITHISITLTASDYAFPGNTFTDFSAATALNYLAYRYPTPAANQMVIMTYNYFETGATASTGNIVTDTFLFVNKAWVKAYSLSPAQYTLVNRGTNNWFVATDAPNLVYDINAILKADPLVMAAPKVGDFKYVAYKFTATYEKVLGVTYDGTNWVARQTLGYLKLNGTWVPDPTIYLTIPDSPAAWTAVTSGTTIGSDAARANLKTNGDFDIRPTSASTWPDDQITAAILLVLPPLVPKPVVGIPYRVTYSVYTGSTSTNYKTFVYDGTKFSVQ